MKLYMWTKDVLRDWVSGMAFAVAETEEDARRLIQEEVSSGGYDLCLDDFTGPPDEVRDLDKSSAYYKWGSG